MAEPRRVFISWSRARSKAIAGALRDWLPNVFQTIDLFMSDVDIEAGGRWGEDISKNLDACGIGVVCVTPENREAPWLLFEAGALAKRLQGNKAKVIPYLFGLEAGNLASSPLAQFQARQADEDGTFAVVSSINAELEKPLPPDRLQTTFDRWWPDLRDALAASELVNGATLAPPTERELLNETIGLLRSMADVLAPVSTTIATVQDALDSARMSSAFPAGPQSIFQALDPSGVGRFQEELLRALLEDQPRANSALLRLFRTRRHAVAAASATQEPGLGAAIDAPKGNDPEGKPGK